MYRLLLLIALTVLTTGCAKDSHEQVTREYLDVVGQLIKVCDNLSEQTKQAEKTDPETEGQEDAVTKEAKEKIGQLLTELKQLKKRLERLGDVDQPTRDKISKKYKNEFDSLTTKFSETVSRIKKQESIAQALESELKTLANLLNAKVS